MCIKTLGNILIYTLLEALPIYLHAVCDPKEGICTFRIFFVAFLLPAKFESKYFAVEKYFMHIIFTEFFFLFFQVLKVSWENQLYHLHIVL